MRGLQEARVRFLTAARACFYKRTPFPFFSLSLSLSLSLNRDHLQRRNERSYVSSRNDTRTWFIPSRGKWVIYISLETVWNEKELRSLKILGILCLERFVRPSLYGILNHRSINISIFSKVLSLFLIARAIVGANAKGNFMVFRYLTSVSHTGSCNDPCKSSLCKLLKKPPLPCLLSSLDIYIYTLVGCDRGQRIPRVSRWR